MGYTITCKITLDEQRPAQYWWPLVFDVLWRRQFTFDNPWYLPQHLGTFLRFTKEPSDVEDVSAASFRSLWDAITAMPSDDAVTVAPTFWSTRSNLAGWDIVCHLARQRLSIWTFSLGPGNKGASPEQILAENSAALSCFVTFACDLFGACTASSAEFNYERFGVVSRFGAIGAPLALEWWASPSEHEPYEATVDEVTLSKGSTLVIVNPFELIKKGWPIPLDLRR